MYERQTFAGERFGKVDFSSSTSLKGLGQLNMDSPPPLILQTQEQPRMPSILDTMDPSMASGTATGSSIGSVLTGIGQILAPLAQAGVGIYKSKLDADAAKRAAKAEAQQMALLQQQQAMMMSLQQQQPSGSSNTGVILLGMTGLAGLVLVIILLLRKKS